MKQHAQQHNKDPDQCRLLLPVYYLDAFEQSCTRQKSVIRIYMAFTNMPHAEYKTTASRVLLTLIPKTINLWNAVHHIIVKPTQLLEQGVDIRFSAEAQDRRCYGSTYTILGNHPSQMEMAGTLPHTHARARPHAHAHAHPIFN
jgi:hypothetical protein